VSHPLKRKIANNIFKVLKWLALFLFRIRRISAYINYYLVTLLGFILATCLYLPTAQKAIINFKNLDTIFIAAGGMIGTILALVFSLSIIPLQRAGEIFTPSITKLYRDDIVTQLIFSFLATFCLLSFILSIDGILFGIKSSVLLPLEIVMVAITLDLLRWHYRRISQLLEPREAIHRLSLNIVKYINQTQRTVSRIARIRWYTLSKEEKANQAKEEIESALYMSASNHSNVLNTWSGELAEIAQKAVSRSETHTAEIAISTMAETACHYLSERKDNLMIFPSPDAFYLASDSDVRSVLTPIYEHLLDVNRNAVATKAETTSIHVVKSLGTIASYTVRLKARAFHKNTAPLTYAPLYYLKECVETAQRNNLDDVALQGSDILLGITKAAPDNTQSTDVHLPAIEGWFKISLAFLITGKGTLANEVLKDMMTLAHHLQKGKHCGFTHILQDILEKIEALVPLAIAHEKNFGSPLVGLPLSPPYDLSNSMSIAHLVAGAASEIKKEENNKPWINPYSEFIELNEAIYRHFRNLAEKVDFGSSFILWHIIQTIKHIARVYLYLLKTPVTDNTKHIHDLVQQVLRHEAFFWVVFSKATIISLLRAREACDALAWIGMAFYDAGYEDIAETSAGNIASIVDSFFKTTKNPNPYDGADLLMHIWYIRLLSESKKDSALVSTLEKRMEKPKTLPDDQWAEVVKALETRKEQLNDELLRPDRHRVRDDAEGLLRDLMERDGQKVHKNQNGQDSQEEDA
jgi:hypothetical protein